MGWQTRMLLLRGYWEASGARAAHAGLDTKALPEPTMITNLVATVAVTLATNVSEVLPKHMVSGPYPPGTETLAIYIGHAEDDANPKEKWVTTNIVEVTSIRFDAFGQQYEAKSERAVTNWTTHFLLGPPEPTKWNRDTNNVPIPTTWFR